jgi:hypothetical protein
MENFRLSMASAADAGENVAAVIVADERTVHVACT